MFVLSRVNGLISLKELMSACRIERLELERILTKLVQSDLILFADASIKRQLIHEAGEREQDDEPTAEGSEVADTPDEDPTGPATKKATGREAEVTAAAGAEERGEWTLAGFFPLMLDFYTRKRTGVLRLHGPEQQHKTLFFEDGDLVNVSSSPFIPGECLGRVIQRAGLLEQHDVVESLRRAKHSGRLQGVELVEMGAIRDKRLGEMLRIQVEVKLTDLFAWSEGTYVFRPTTGLPGKVARIHIDFPRLMFNLIWKRYPIEWIDEELRERMDLFLGVVERPNFRVGDFEFGEGLEKFYTIVAERDAPLKRVMIVTNLKPEQTKRMVWSLYLLGLVGFFKESREDRVMIRIQQLTEDLKIIEQGTMFEVLSVHWTANDAKVREVHERRIAEVDAAIRNSQGLEEQLHRQFRGHIAKAYDFLKEQASRRAYRYKIFDPDFIEFGADILRQKGESYLFTKEDLPQAIIELESALEVYEKDGEYWAELGLAYFIRDHLRDVRGAERARQMIRRGLAMSPNSPITNLCLGLMYKHERKTKQAIEALQRVLQLEEKNRFAKILLHEIRTGEKHGERDKAVKEFLERERAADKEFDERMAAKRKGETPPPKANASEK
ncbi:MAG: hypothetical protein P9L99_19900 [Candidatus Lernaella stagnicola]|nr:hypothetical protein [Candidatus Lernaella stagnicola]